MATVASGTSAVLYFPLSGTLVVTPEGKARFGCLSRDGVSPAPRTIHSQTTIEIPSGSDVFLDAVDGDVAYTSSVSITPPGGSVALSADAMQAAQSALQSVSDAGRASLWDFARDGSTSISAVSASCTFEASTFDGESCLKITGTGAAQAQIDIDLSATPWAFNGGLGFDIIADRGKTTSLAILASADASFAAYAQLGSNPAAASTTSCLTYRTVQPYTIVAFPGGSPADPAWSPGYQGTWASVAPTYPTELTKIRVRASNASGQTPVFYLRRVYATAPRMSRVFVTLDDGYASAFRLLKPVLDAYGIKASWSIIGDLVGYSSLYMTADNLRTLYAQGHEIVTHGPIGGTGNIVDNYSTLEEGIADVLATRTALTNLGVMSEKARRVYVWPQGRHQSATDDLSYHESLTANGFTVGRTASVFAGGMKTSTWPSKMVLPIIGHTQAASSGAESTNISGLVSAIDNAAARGLDVILMFHAGVTSADTDWGSNGGLNIRTTDLATICAAIKTNVLAGTQTVSLLSDA